MEDYVLKIKDIENIYKYDRRDAGNTQVSSTSSTYVKIIDELESLYLYDKGTPILDYPCGLGMGALHLMTNSHNVTTVEPYYNTNKGALPNGTPDYNNINCVRFKYNTVLCIYCLNVVPMDLRTDILKSAYSKVMKGGNLIITVRGKIPGKPLHKLSDTEFLMAKNSTNSYSGMTYQKSHTTNQLKQYVKDTLGDGCEIIKALKAGDITLVVKRLSI
jgi:hypothetical protein